MDKKIVRKCICSHKILTGFLILITLTVSFPQIEAEGEIDVVFNFNTDLTLPQGAASSITIIIENTARNDIKLDFTGIHFDWLDEHTYLYGDGSELKKTLHPNEKIEYTIPFNVPSRISSGIYKTFILIAYSIENDGSWISHHHALEISPGINVIQIITVTQTEIFTTIVNKASSQNPSILQKGIAITAAIILLAFVFIRIYLNKRRIQKETC